MNKSILWGAIILIALFTFLIWAGFLQLPNKTTVASKAVPKDAIAVLQIPNLSNVIGSLEKSIYFNALQKWEWLEALCDATNLLNQLSEDEPMFSDTEKIISSLHLNQQKKVELLHILPAEKYGNKPFKFFRKAFVNEKDKIQPKTFKGVTIYKAQTNVNNFTNIVFAECEDLILFSKSVALIEKSISTLKADIVNEESIVIKPHKLSSKTPQFSLYLNFEQYAKSQQTLQNDKTTALNKWIGENTNLFNGDVFATSGKLVINGAFKHQNLFLKALHANAGSSKFDLRAFIPESITGFRWYGVNNFYAFLESYLEQTDVEQANWLLNISEGLGNECLINWHNSSATELSFLFSITDLEKVGNSLDDSFSKASSNKIKSLKQNALINFVASQTEFNQLKAASLWYTFHAGYLMIANSKKIIENNIAELKTGKTLHQSQHFIDFESNLISNAVSIIYLKNDRLDTWIDQQFSNFNSSQQTEVQNFHPIIVQLYPAKKDLYLHTTVAYKGKGLAQKIDFDFEQPVIKKFFDKKPKKSKWQNLVGEKIMNGPHQFLNHYTGVNESLVQDGNHTLYLIDPQDSILWKKKLDGPILGGIRAIDYYQNNKLQILLNTSYSIYLIDRKGRDVNTFPVKLDQHASNPLSLVHYKDLNKIRYFVIGEKGKLMGFNKDGTTLKGWKFNESVGEVEQPLLHFISDKKDYLCVVNKEGLVYMFSRNGTLRTNHPIQLNIKNIQSLSAKEGTNGNKYLHITYNKNKTMGVKIDGSVIDN